jgi:hypothetical protein
MNRITQILLIIGLMIWAAPAVYPCSPDIKSHRQDYRKAKAVFVGRVISVEAPSDVPEKLRGYVDKKVTFSVEKRWKGANNPTISVLASYGPVTCHGFEFREGERYLVSAFGDELLVGTMFSRSRPIDREDEQARKEMRQLNSSWFRLTSRLPFLK